MADEPAPPPPPPQDLEDHLGFWLRRVSNHVSARFTRLVEAQGVTVSEWVALRRLYPDQDASPAALTVSLGLTKGAVSKVLDRLEARGLARRTPDGADRRQVHVGLTDAGRALTVTLAGLADENDRFFFGHLDQPTQNTLLGLLQGLATTHQIGDVPVD